MASYTTELYNVMRDMGGNYSNPLMIQNMAPIILSSWEAIFTPFPIWEESYREVLCTKILAHYYNREIGSETPALFIFRLNRKMQEIMPYYVQLYNTQLFDVDIDNIEVNLYDEYQENEKGDSRDENTANRTTGTEDKRTKEEKADESSTGTSIHSGENGTQSSSTSSGSEKNNETDSMNRDLTSHNTSQSTNNNTIDGSDRTDYNSTTTDTYNRTDTTTLGSGLKHSGSDSVTHSGNDITKSSDTPQGALTNLLNDTYLTQAQVLVHGEVINTQYGQTETKTGTDTLKQTGTIASAKSGNDTVTHKSTEEGTVNSLSDGTEKENETKNIEGTKTHDEQASESSTSKDSSNDNHTEQRNNTLTSTEDYISNFLERSGYFKNGDYTKDNWYNKHTHGHDSINWIDGVLKWRESLINIDMMIIEDLEPLFMGLW